MGLKHCLVAFLALVACRDPGGTDQPKPRAFGGVISPTSPPVSAAALAAAIPGTANGQTLAWNGTTYAPNATCGDPSQRYCGIEEFEIGTACTTIGKFVGTVTGAGAGCTYGAFDAGHPGVLTMATGSTATGGARDSIGSTIVLGGSVGESCTRQLVQILNLSTTTIEHVSRWGFVEPVSNVDSVDAVEAIYDRAATSVDKWALRTCSNSVCTTTICDGTGGTVNAPVVAATWTTLEECVNAAGSSATLKVNGVTCATNTTNIPTGVARATSVGYQCFNNTGSVPASQICYLDYVWWSLPFGVAR